MASKLDPFHDELFDQLNNRGMSYRSVCNILLGMGVEISAQSLRSWHVRRSRKIAARSGVSPSVMNRSTIAPVDLPAGTQPRKTTAVQQARPMASFVEKDALQKEIAQQEQGLATTPFSQQSLGFLVKRKH